MVWLSILFFVLILVLFIKESGDSVGKVVVLSILLTAFGTSAGVYFVEEANKQYAAANRQHIDVTATFLSDGPVVTQPCRIQLEMMGSKLVLPGTVREVTPHMVNVICGKE